MATTTDNSVLMALSELKQMESTRLDDERTRAAARAQAQKDETERTAAAALALAEAARVQETLQREKVAAEARARVEAELEHDRRLAAMRAELDSIRRDRDVIHGTLTARAAAAAQPPRSRGLAIAFGVSSSVAAALAALMVVQANQHVAVVPAAAPAASTEIVTALASEAAELETSIEVELAGETPESPVAPAAPAARPDGRPIRDRVRPHHDRTDDPHPDLGTALDFGESDGMVPVGH